MAEPGPWDLKELLGAGHKIQDVSRRFLNSTNPFLLGVVFQKLPLPLRQRWWAETDYGRLIPSPALVAAIADHISATARKCAEMLDAQENPTIFNPGDAEEFNAQTAETETS
jgi:hypothetical protein